MTINHAQYLDTDGGDSAVVIEASARSIRTSFGWAGGEDQGCPHRVRRQIMVGCSPRLGRASHHYLSSSGNIKTKAVGRNSEPGEVRFYLAFVHILVGFAICDGWSSRKDTLDLLGSSSIVWTLSDIHW